MESHTDFNNKITTYAYHPLNDRLQRVDYEDGNFELYSYYDAGQVKTITTVAGTVKYEYDRRDRLTLETKANGDSIAYDYDDVGNRTEVTTTVNGTSATTTYLYNVLNQLEQVKEGSVVITSYTYDNAGNLKTTTAENELVTTYNYDAVNRLDDMAITDTTGTVVESYDYILRDSGRRAQVIEANGRTVDYGYDDLYRLTTESVTDVINGDYSATYTYDDVGNRKTSIVDGVTTAFGYDDNDRLLTAGNATYGYDDQGNQLTITDGSNVTKQSYDDLNKLINSQVNSEPEISFSYDARGIRVSRTHNGITTQYLVDHNRDYAQVLAEVNNGQLDTSYIYGHDLIKQEKAGNNSFYLTDGIGSTRLLSDDAGVVTDSYDYAAFGELLNQTGETENSYRYTGEQYDAGLDKYYLRARYYDQGVGRFTQQDSWLGKQHSPVTLNKYLYAHSDPANFIDPTGNFSLSGVMSAINTRATLGTLSQNSARHALTRFLVGNTSRTTAAGTTTSGNSLGFIGNMVMSEMREAVIDTLMDYAISGIDPFKSKATFGTKAHRVLEDRIEELNDRLNSRFKMTKRWGIEVKAEAFFDKGTGKYGANCRRCRGSFGIDVTIMKNNKVLKSFDLKTGGGWSKPESGRRAGKLGSNLFQIYIVPKK